MPGTASNRQAARRRAGDPAARLRDHLLRQPPERLVDELVRACERDPVLAARLHAAAEADDAADAAAVATGLAPAEGEAADRDRVADLAAALLAAIGAAEEGLDRCGTPAWADDVDAVLGQIEKLVDDGLADDARRLAEEALDLLEDVLPVVPDDGEGFRLLEHAELLHHRACVTARPDRIALGEYLAERAMTSSYLVFERALRTYADVLSYSGRAAFEAAVEAGFAELPPLRPGDRHARDHGGRARVASLMEDIAARRGTDPYVRAVARDLSDPHRFVLVARRLADDGRPGEALDWLGRAGQAFGHDHAQLEGFTAELLRRLGRHDEALAVVRRQFDAHPTLAGYRALRDYAEAAGSWPQERAEALALLREQPPSAVPTGDVPVTGGSGPGHSTLVEVLLWEGDVDGAWAAARAGGCSGQHWLAVARARAQRHPEDAVPVLQRAIRRAVLAADREGYAVAAELGSELLGYAERAGRSEAFAAWIRQVRAENARRPALQEEFTRAGLPR